MIDLNGTQFDQSKPKCCDHKTCKTRVDDCARENGGYRWLINGAVFQKCGCRFVFLSRIDHLQEDSCGTLTQLVKWWAGHWQPRRKETEHAEQKMQRRCNKSLPKLTKCSNLTTAFPARRCRCKMRCDSRAPMAAQAIAKSRHHWRK